MKKVACAVLVFTMIIFLVNPLSSDANGRGGHGDHSDEGYWVVPVALIAGAVVVWAVTVFAAIIHHYSIRTSTSGHPRTAAGEFSTSAISTETIISRKDLCLSPEGPERRTTG